MMFVVIKSTGKIALFLAFRDPDLMSNWIVPMISVLLLLKHLSSATDLSGCFFVFVDP